MILLLIATAYAFVVICSMNMIMGRLKSLQSGKSKRGDENDKR